MQQSRVDSRGEWSLVVHRVSQTTAEILVGSLFPDFKKPDSAKVVLTSSDKEEQVVEITKKKWRRPFNKINQRFYYIAEFNTLKPNTRYELKFYGDIEKKPSWWQRLLYTMPDKEVNPELKLLQVGDFKTLPENLSVESADSFTVALGSCFYPYLDGGRASDAYKMLYKEGETQHRPDVAFLTGDQVYLDIGFDSLSLRPKEIRNRVAEDYAKHWKGLSGILRHGGTWMLPDDHEYWNDYPFYDSNLIPLLWPLKLPWVRRSWRSVAKDGVNNLQRTNPIEIFSIGNDISFCLADLRSYRCGDRVTTKGYFQELLDWANSLESPGVLVLPQPLIVEKNNVERNLRSFADNYEQLIQSLGSSGHDIVVLSGDVHFGRVACVELGDKRAKLIEVISSPMSNLSLINAIATNEPTNEPKTFPPSDGKSVQYKSSVSVADKSLHYMGRKRTNEHFMTVAFHRSDEGVSMTVCAWLIRKTSEEGLPVKDFQEKFVLK